jgi:hypothetical protein
VSRHRELHRRGGDADTDGHGGSCPVRLARLSAPSLPHALREDQEALSRVGHACGR